MSYYGGAVEAGMKRIAALLWAIVALLGAGDLGAADADPRFVATWQGTIKSVGGSTTLHVVMLPDGGFTTIIASDAGDLRIVGSYRVVDARTIHFVNRDYQPRSSCTLGDGGERICTTVDIPAEETDSYAFEDGGETLIIANPEAGEIRFKKVE
jgi:hypothetical protein